MRECHLCRSPPSKTGSFVYSAEVTRDNPLVSDERFELEAGSTVRAWLQAHPSDAPRVIAYDVHRCCGGGKICQVRVRELSRKDDPGQYATGVMDDGTRFLIDRRAAARLPSRFALAVRGLGRFKHLDLELEGEQWGTLLYD